MILTASVDRLVHLYSIDVNADQDVAEREKGMVSLIVLTCFRMCAMRVRSTRDISASRTTYGISSLPNSTVRL
jgi:hypothetical protein